ncbi:MAG: hypothetical protein KAJ10_12115 [Thermodesulfovibrionia bacterium]|nr:hypothetical protein [Thermodesulfovibrionia bacterium]
MLFILFIACVLLSGCLTAEKVDLVFFIKKGGNGTVEYHVSGIRSDEEGQKAKDEINELFEDVKKNDALGNSLQLLNYKETVAYDEQGNLNGRVYGEFTDVTHLLRILSGHDKAELDKNEHFELRWKDGRLYIGINEGIKDREKDDRMRIVFRTEGMFVEGTTGEISEDRKETELHRVNMTDLVLIIDGLEKK